MTRSPSAPLCVIERPALDALRRRGYTVVGPTVRSRSIEYDELRSADDLPVGWTDGRHGGAYGLPARAVAKPVW